MRLRSAHWLSANRHFRDLVPTRSGKGNLYTHLFRAVYATIAAHWFCPPNVSDLEFRAYIQGHFQILNETQSEKRTSMAAQRHYWDYKIADGQGNVDGRLGIKLQQTGIQVLEAFDQSKTTTTTNLKEDRSHKVHLRVFNDDRTHLASIQSQFDLNSRADAFHYCLELAQSLLSTANQMDIPPEQLTERLANLDSQSLSKSIPEVEAEPSSFFHDSEKPSKEEHEQQLSLTLNQNESEPTTTEESDSSNVNQTNAVGLTPSEVHSQTEELSNQTSQTATQKLQLFERMDRQQQSIEGLTHAIHGLVEVLANSPHPSSTNQGQHSKSEAGSDRSWDLVQSQPLSKPLAQCPQKTSDTQVTSSTSDEVKQDRSRKHRSFLSRQKVNQYIERIMAYNDVLERPHSDKWLITIGFASARSAIAALKRLTHCGQSVIYDVLNSRASEIQFHHDKHQLGIYHNQKGKNSTKIESVFS